MQSHCSSKGAHSPRTPWATSPAGSALPEQRHPQDPSRGSVSAAAAGLEGWPRALCDAAALAASWPAELPEEQPHSIFSLFTKPEQSSDQHKRCSQWSAESQWAAMWRWFSRIGPGVKEGKQTRTSTSRPSPSCPSYNELFSF